MKIALIGHSGSGKSTLAKKLSEKYRVPVLYLDTVHWLPGWQEREREDEYAIVKAFLDENPEGWVIDGNYTKLLRERRLEEADKIIYMSFNRVSCLWRAAKRRKKYAGRSRDSMTEGCNERLHGEFIKWILFDSRTKERMEKFNSVLSEYPEKTVVIKSQRALVRFENEEGLPHGE